MDRGDGNSVPEGEVEMQSILISDHCECSHPMTVPLNDNGIWNGTGVHDSDRETMEGLAKVLDVHHKPMLCGKCDGTGEFDVGYHFGKGVTVAFRK